MPGNYPQIVQRFLIDVVKREQQREPPENKIYIRKLNRKASNFLKKIEVRRCFTLDGGDGNEKHILEQSFPRQ